MIEYWDDGVTPKSTNTAFTLPGTIKFSKSPDKFRTMFVEEHKREVIQSDASEKRMMLDAAGRPVMTDMGRKKPSLTIATPEDKKFKRKQGAAI